MGHSRIIGAIKGRAFSELTALCNSAIIAGQVLEATLKELNYEMVKNDVGYQESMRLLVQLGSAAQSKDFLGYLRQIGLDLPNKPNIEDVIDWQQNQLYFS